jgi:hypothetical protein
MEGRQWKVRRENWETKWRKWEGKREEVEKRTGRGERGKQEGKRDLLRKTVQMVFWSWSWSSHWSLSNDYFHVNTVVHTVIINPGTCGREILEVPVMLIR